MKFDEEHKLYYSGAKDVMVYVESVGHISEDTVMRYIEEQKGK